MLELQYRLDYFSNMKRIKHWLLHVLGQISIFFSQVIHLYGNTNQKRRHHSHDSNVENGGQGKAREHQEMLAIHGYAALGFLDQKAPFEAWISSHLNLSSSPQTPNTSSVNWDFFYRVCKVKERNWVMPVKIYPWFMQYTWFWNISTGHQDKGFYILWTDIWWWRHILMQIGQVQRLIEDL